MHAPKYNPFLPVTCKVDQQTGSRAINLSVRAPVNCSIHLPSFKQSGSCHVLHNLICSKSTARGQQNYVSQIKKRILLLTYTSEIYCLFAFTLGYIFNPFSWAKTNKVYRQHRLQHQTTRLMFLLIYNYYLVGECLLNNFSIFVSDTCNNCFDN